MQAEPKEFRDYLGALRRRKGRILGTMFGILFVSAAVAFGLPPVYRSTATILIEEQEIPPDLVRSTITSYADQRIQVISQRVMTRGNLLAIVNKYDLYAKERRTEATEEILETMREDVGLQMVSADVIDPRSGRPTQATIAFSLSYDGASPQIAQQVANELVSLYLTENIKSRTQKAEETSDFLAEDTERLGAYLAELEERLARFKEHNIGRLPEQMELNLQLSERAERELQGIQSQITSLEERKIYLQGQLAQISPRSPMISSTGERILDAETRLKVLQVEYVSALARYGAEHPDIVNMKRQIEALRKETGSVAGMDERAQEIVRLETELALAREKYSEDHPDVIRLKKAVASLNEAGAGAPPAAAVDSSAATPENPAYINLQSQLEAADGQLRALLDQRRELRAKLAGFEERLVQTPEVEREYLALTREHQNTLRRYQEVKAKQMEAQVAQELERKRKGERFTLVEPPQLPELPVQPNRLAILFLGLVFSVGGGLGFAAVAENLDNTVRSPRAVLAVAGAPPLAVIPFIETDADRSRRRRAALLTAAAAAAAVAVVLLMVHFLWQPLDVIWFAGLRRAGEAFGL